MKNYNKSWTIYLGVGLNKLQYVGERKEQQLITTKDSLFINFTVLNYNIIRTALHKLQVRSSIRVG